MRIGMEVSPLIWEMSGIPNYILRLLKGLAQVDSENEYFLYTNREIPFNLDLPDNFRVEVLNRPSPRFQLWFQFQLPLRLKKDHIDLFHGLFYRLPLILPVPGVVTVHDLSGYLMPRLHSRKTHLVNLLYPVFVRKASEIIAVSGFTADELRKNFPVSSGKITVVHEAAPGDYAPVEDRERLNAVRCKYDLPKQFMIFLGTLEPRKNLPRLLEAFSRIAGSIPQSMVIAGSMGWKTETLLRMLESADLKDSVHLTGFVNSEDVPALFSLSDFSIYPSIYEGFGLPVLESMACGSPVITSSVSSMPEIAGEAAVLVDPLSVDSISTGIRNLALDPGRRRELSAAGLKRAGEFSWRRAAEETLEVYRSVIARQRN